MKPRIHFVFFLILAKAAAIIGHHPCYDSFDDNNINTCLFDSWRAVGVGVLSAVVECNGNNDVQLCYGDKLEGTNNVLFAVCYNTETRIPKFTGHVLRGRGTEGVANMVPDGKVDENWRTDDSDLLANQATDADYTASQSGLFCSEYKKGSPHLYLGRGHLTPAGDFKDTNNERSFTYVLTNIAPQWQPLNMGNWVAVEKAIRNYAKSTLTGKTLYIVTGTGGRAKINDQEIKLKENVVTPQYFWKAVCDPVKKQSIVFVAENKPGNTDPSKDNTGCELTYKLPTGGDKITNRIPQTRMKGVIKCSSLEEAKLNHPDFSLPPFSDLKCKKNDKGEFLDQLLADQLRKLNN